MKTTVLKEILAFIFGRKYYANVLNINGTSKMELSCFIFRTKEEALKQKADLLFNRSYKVVETISFRSRRVY